MQFENVTCPHCGILCDDLSINVNGSQVTPINADNQHCLKAYQDASFEDSMVFSSSVNGENTPLDDAIKKATDLLKNSQHTLVSGLIADVQSCREAIALTDKLHGVIDHANGTGMLANMAVMQRFGQVKTTLAEARNRADNIIIFGAEVLDRFPRFLERILTPKTSLGDDNTVNKTITIIDSVTVKTQKTYSHKNIQHIKLNAPTLDSIIQNLQRIVFANLEQCDQDDTDTQSLIHVYQSILNSNYTTLVWNSSLFDKKFAEQSIQALTIMSKEIMKTHRCVGLSLGGSKGEITASHVATWQTGVPLPISFSTGAPIHDPVIYNGVKMIENKEVDCLVWIATYSPDDTPPDTDIPTIVIGHPKMKLNQNSAVFIPVGIPGVDTRGLACRTDSVATLPLPKIRTVDLPSAQNILVKLTSML